MIRFYPSTAGTLIDMNSGRIRSWLALVTASLLALSCATAEEAPTDDLRLWSEPELHERMRWMAGSLNTMTFSAVDEKLPLAKRQAVVLSQLDRIEAVASSIGGDDVVTNYSVINRYMGAFLYDVILSREFAERDPPNLVPASRLINSCLSCHDSI